jgi:hypothetical protein
LIYQHFRKVTNVTKDSSVTFDIQTSEYGIHEKEAIPMAGSVYAFSWYLLDAEIMILPPALKIGAIFFKYRGFSANKKAID